MSDHWGPRKVRDLGHCDKATLGTMRRHALVVVLAVVMAVGDLHPAPAAAAAGAPIWFLRGGTLSTFQNVFVFGAAGDRPVVGGGLGLPFSSLDIQGIGVDRQGQFFLRNIFWEDDANEVFTYGIPTDVPVFGRWQGQVFATVGVYRNGVFFLRNSNTSGVADVVAGFGDPGDTPIVGDWNGDGIDTIGVVRRGTFYLRNTNTTGNADVVFPYGLPGDTPIVGDWDGSGGDTVGVYRGNTFLLRQSNTPGNADVGFVFGSAGNTPIVGDWDGCCGDTVGVVHVPA